MMDFRDVAILENSEVFEKFQSSERGLTSKEASERITRYGMNKIKSHEITAWDIFIRQFKSPFVYLLFFAALIAFLIGEKIDSYMILGFVVLNSFLGFYQEYKSEATVKLLKKYLASKIRVIRDGKQENIDTPLLVPGDILLFEPGDIIPADVRFVESRNLIVDETVLTGESAPVSKSANPISDVKDIYDAANVGFSGTTVVSGQGKAVVFATGGETNYAKIVKLAGETEKESSFEKELSRFSKFTLWVVLATLIFIVVTSVAVKPNPSLTELVIFSIALAVSVIPETLPVVTTFSLSLGAFRLTKKSVIVKRLTAVEDLGSLEVLASDKTGTLTENKLEVANTFGVDNEKLLLFATLASYFIDTSRNAQSNAFDIALQLKLTAKAKRSLKGFNKIADIPFDPQRKHVTALLEEAGKTYIVSRGSVESILEICKNSKDRVEAEKWASREGVQGRRSLAVAIREVKKADSSDGLSKLEKDMQFIGLVSFSDPIKPSAYKAIDKARNLGVRVKIITGDSPEVAGAVAKEIGLIESMREVITGSEFEKLSIDKKHEAVGKYNVFARIVPEQKHQIISLLKEKSYVGFLGEGINDAPALKAANVAVVVNEGSDVAKEAADIVLLERDLEVIMDGVTEGRRIFANTSKYITATMASNFGNFFAVAIIAPFINFLPMLPLQILLVNLLSDFPMIMVATDTVDEGDLSTPRKYDLKKFATSALSFGFLSTAFDFIVFKSFYPMGEANLQTYWFIESILSELLLIFSIRTTKPFFLAKIPSKSLMILTVVIIGVTITLPFTGLGQDLFGFVGPNLSGLTMVFVIVFSYLIANEVVKLLMRRYQK